MPATQEIHYSRKRTVKKTYKKKYYVKKTNSSTPKSAYKKTVSSAKGNQNHCPTCGAFIGNKGR